MTTDEANALEVTLFDQWVLERRAGRVTDVNELAAWLPADRRAAFLKMLNTTAAVQGLCGVDPTKPREEPT